MCYFNNFFLIERDYENIIFNDALKTFLKRCYLLNITTLFLYTTFRNTSLKKGILKRYPIDFGIFKSVKSFLYSEQLLIWGHVSSATISLTEACGLRSREVSTLEAVYRTVMT